MKLVVHIGHGKTGSSSIQRTLKNSREKFIERNIFYMGMNLEFSPVQLYGWQKEGDLQGLLELKNEIGEAEVAKQVLHLLNLSLVALKEQDVEVAVWSNEGMLASPELFLLALNAMANRSFKVDIVAYIRRHDKWALSAYSQWGIKHKTYAGTIKSFDEWADESIEFYPLLEPWLGNKWCETHVRNFDACGNVVTDFFKVTEIDADQVEIIRDNDTPKRTALCLWALHNNNFEDVVYPNDIYPMLAKSGVLQKAYKPIELNKLFPSQDQIEEVLNNSRGDIVKLNELFHQTGQPDFSEEPYRHSQQDISSEQLFSCMIDILQYQEVRHESLINRVKVLEEALSQNRESDQSEEAS